MKNPEVSGLGGVGHYELKIPLEESDVCFKLFKYCILLYIFVFVYFPISSKSNSLEKCFNSRPRIFQFEPFVLSIHPAYPNLFKSF